MWHHGPPPATTGPYVQADRVLISIPARRRSQRRGILGGFSRRTSYSYTSDTSGYATTVGLRSPLWSNIGRI